MKKFVIAISRQFGCGAHEISEKLSKQLSVPVYDKEIIKLSATESGIDENIFQFYDERPSRSFLYSLMSDGYAAVTNSPGTLEDKVFLYQYDTIKKVAEENCIIVGRCADYILRENDALFSVFLYADMDYRRARVIDTYGIDAKDAVKEIRATDKKRARFHDFYSDSKWGDATSYDLCINVARFGVDGAVDLIIRSINNICN